METALSTSNQYQPDINIQARESFLKSLDAKPEKVDKAQGYDTIPISALETILDETYLGLWETVNFRYQVIANEIVGTIDLRVFDPSVKTWITRTGNASVMIRQTSGAPITDIGAKIKNGLAMDFPRLSTMCLKAAAKTLGKKFGRDLNRKFEDSYEEIYTNQIDLNEVIDGLKAQMNKCESREQLGKVWKENEALHNNSAAVKLFKSFTMKINLNKNGAKSTANAAR